MAIERLRIDQDRTSFHLVTIGAPVLSVNVTAVPSQLVVWSEKAWLTPKIELSYANYEYISFVWLGQLTGRKVALRLAASTDQITKLSCTGGGLQVARHSSPGWGYVALMWCRYAGYKSREIWPYKTEPMLNVRRVISIDNWYTDRVWYDTISLKPMQDGRSAMVWLVNGIYKEKDECKHIKCDLGCEVSGYTVAENFPRPQYEPLTINAHTAFISFGWRVTKHMSRVAEYTIEAVYPWANRVEVQMVHTYKHICARISCPGLVRGHMCIQGQWRGLSSRNAVCPKWHNGEGPCTLQYRL